MIITWRVVAIDSTGSRIIVDEQLSAERANEVRDLMIHRGHNAIVEAEVPAEQNGNPQDLPVDPVQWTSDGQSGSREATILADPQ